MPKKIKNHVGFSFLEAIISIFILVSGIVAVISLVASSLRQASYAKDHQIAILLAEEGAELVRNLRDNNWVDSNPGVKSFDAGFPNSDRDNCFLDDNSTALLCNNSSKRLQLNGGFYRVQPSSGTDTKFFRVIHVDYDGNSTTATTATITSVVYWGTDPGNTINDSSCNAANFCTYVRTDLKRWGEV